MAPASQIELSLRHPGVFHVPDITATTADKTSQCLQNNHDNHHIFFNSEGFHNHIAHHLLTLYALGATPQEIQDHFNRTKQIQRPPVQIHPGNVDHFQDREKLVRCLGDENNYRDFLIFFQQEIDDKGYEAVIHDYLFADTEVARALLVRMYAGFLHPLIHLGFGIEFAQPAIVAEAFAEAAVHDGWIGDFLLPAEEAARSVSESKGIFTLIDEIRANTKLSAAAHWSDANKIRDGLIARAPDEIIHYASQWKVGLDEIESKTAEMINANAYFNAAAQNPPKAVKYDFFYMHCLNCSIFFSSFLQQDWLSNANKARLLEWKGRTDLAMYASRGSPKLLLDEITTYRPKNPNDGWEEVFERVRRHNDDGHAAKLLRALANGQRECTRFEDSDALKVKSDMWMQMAHMAIDSVASEPRWVRSTGFQEAWKNIGERPRF